MKITNSVYYYDQKLLENEPCFLVELPTLLENRSPFKPTTILLFHTLTVIMISKLIIVTGLNSYYKFFLLYAMRLDHTLSSTNFNVLVMNKY